MCFRLQISKTPNSRRCLKLICKVYICKTCWGKRFVSTTCKPKVIPYAAFELYFFDHCSYRVRSSFLAFNGFGVHVFDISQRYFLYRSCILERQNVRWSNVIKILPSLSTQFLEMVSFMISGQGIYKSYNYGPISSGKECGGPII